MDVFKKRKKNTGRKKIEIKKLDKASNKQVTFSKRRTGLFKKASELCILCNVSIVIIVFSPADKLFCFAHPNIDNIIGRYLKGAAVSHESEPTKSRGKSVSCESEPTKSRGKSVSYEELNMQYEESMKKLELEKKNLAEIETLVKVWNGTPWWNHPIDHLSDEHLEQFMVSAYELRKRLVERVGELMMFRML